MKHTWTKAEAENYVARCERGAEKKGLKYCSAMDFLKNHTPAVITEDAIFSASERKLVVEAYIDAVLASDVYVGVDYGVKEE